VKFTRPLATAAALVAAASPVAAHDAFGDLGPFYQAALHPLADPAQGLLLVATALLLARQPRASVRPAYAALVIAAGVTLAAASFLHLPAPGLRTMAVAALALALATLLAPRPGPTGATLAAALFGAALALPLAPETGTAVPRAALLGLIGGALGIAIVTLWLWGAAEWADRRISPLATSVAAAWVGAIALMTAALPA
jgi:hypothetical protein